MLALVPAAHAGGSSVVFGAAEDRVRSPFLVDSETEMGLLKLAGFQAVRVTSFWEPGLSEPTPHEAMVLANVDAAATMHGVRVYISVYNAGSRTTPLTVVQRKEFASYAAAIAKANPGFRDVIVGNEPNLNRFWMPQFALNGTGASAPAYLRLLATTYDALKEAAPEVRVWGGALAPRGVDKPNTGRDTISPTRFLRELGAAYRKSGRALPVMDGFSFHPYPLNSSVPVDALPSDPDHLGLIDQDVLVKLLGKAFDGTAQVGRGMPILYDEFGIESAIPAEKRELYGGVEPATTRPVPEATQAAAYRRAIQLAYCQSNVAGMLLFHTHDEPGRPGWQSGLVYADGSPKTSLEPVRRAIESAGTNALGACPVEAKVSAAFTTAERTISLRCERACTYRARLLRLPRRTAVATTTGRAAAGRRLLVPVGPAESTPGWYQLTVSFLDAVAAWTPSRARQYAVRGACLLAAALLAGCGGDDGSGSPLLVGAVDDRVRHDAPALRQLQDAGFGAVGITSFWHPGSNAPSEEEVAALRSVVEARRRHADLPLDLPHGRQDDAADAGRPGGLRLLRHRRAAERARDPRRDHRQRAEPEPLLDAAVRRERRRRRRARLPRAAVRGLRRGQAGRPRRDRLGRRARTAGDRPAGNGPRHALADDVHPRPRRRLPRQRPGGAAVRRLRLPPLPGELEHSARPADQPEVERRS